MQCLLCLQTIDPADKAAVHEQCYLDEVDSAIDESREDGYSEGYDEGYDAGRETTEEVRDVLNGLRDLVAEWLARERRLDMQAPSMEADILRECRRQIEALLPTDLPSEDF